MDMCYDVHFLYMLAVHRDFLAQAGLWLRQCHLNWLQTNKEGPEPHEDPNSCMELVIPYAFPTQDTSFDVSKYGGIDKEGQGLCLLSWQLRQPSCTFQLLRKIEEHMEFQFRCANRKHWLPRKIVYNFVDVTPYIAAKNARSTQSRPIPVDDMRIEVTIPVIGKLPPPQCAKSFGTYIPAKWILMERNSPRQHKGFPPELKSAQDFQRQVDRDCSQLSQMDLRGVPSEQEKTRIWKILFARRDTYWDMRWEHDKIDISCGTCLSPLKTVKTEQCYVETLEYGLDYFKRKRQERFIAAYRRATGKRTERCRLPELFERPASSNQRSDIEASDAPNPSDSTHS